MFRDAAGEPRPIARHGVEPFGWYEPFTKMEVVLGDGGQLRSFDWVFSPRGSEGRPQRLYDPRTGAVDAAVAEAWKRYDIRLILETNWPTLGPRLAGKLHVIAGELDTFYLEGAVRLLQESLDRLGSDAVIEIRVEITPEGPLNPKAGVVPVVLFGSAELSMEDVDRATLAFGPLGSRKAHKSGPHAGDHNGDGKSDLMIHFLLPGSGLTSGDTEACVMGTTTDGRWFAGCDSITPKPGNGRLEFHQKDADTHRNSGSSPRTKGGTE